MKTLSKLLIIIALAMCFNGCSTLAALTAESEAESAAYVAEALSSGNIKFEVNYIIPSRGQSRYSQDGYYLKIVDGKADSNLPFFGVSYHSNPYGNEPSGIRFENCPVQIDKSKSRPEKGQYVWRFVGLSGTDKVAVTLEFSANGSAHLQCSPTNRSNMGYKGNIVNLEVKKK